MTKDDVRSGQAPGRVPRAVCPYLREGPRGASGSGHRGQTDLEFFVE